MHNPGMGSVEYDTAQHLREQADREELFDELSDEIDAHQIVLAKEAITDPEILRTILDDELLAYDLARIMGNLEGAVKEFSALASSMQGNYSLQGLLEAACNLERLLFTRAHGNEAIRERAEQEIVDG